MFIADDLGAWLISLFADGVRRNLTALVLGDELDRALRSAAAAAIELTAAELCPDNSQAAMVINEVFGAPVSDALLAQHTTLLRALETGIDEQLAVLDDASLTGTGRSSADVLGVPARVIAEKLADNLVQRIKAAAARGGPLASLAAQLNHDRTYTQGQETTDAVRQVGARILDAITPLATTQRAQATNSETLPDIALQVEQCFENLGLDQHDEAERRLNRLFMHLTRAQQRAAVAAIISVATRTESHTSQLVACSLLESADRLDPMLVDIEDVETLARAAGPSLRGSAAVLLWQWAESIPGRVPVPLLGRLTQPSTEDWYVHSPARCAAKQLLLSRPAARAIFDRMAASHHRDDRDYAVSDMREVAAIEPRAVPRDFVRKLARDEDKDVAARAIKLLRMLDDLTDSDYWNYYHRFGI